MNDTSFDLLCKDLTAEEAKLFRKMLKEWANGDEDSFPVQLILLTKAQWLAAARLPQLIRESGSVIEQQMKSCRLKVAAIVGNLSAASRENIIELKGMIKAHAEKVNESGVLVRNQLWETEAAAKRIAKTLSEGSAAWEQAKKDFIAERQKLEKEREELAARAQWRDTIYSVIILAGAVALGVLLGYTLKH
jgi:uncharacterized protein YkvS